MLPIIAVACLKLPSNPRVHSDKWEADKFIEYVKSGKIPPIIVTREDYLVLDGVRRVLLAKELGVKFLPYLFGELRLKEEGYRVVVSGGLRHAQLREGRYCTRPPQQVQASAVPRDGASRYTESDQLDTSGTTGR